MAMAQRKRFLTVAAVIMAGALTVPVGAQAQFFGGGWGYSRPYRAAPPSGGFFSFPFFGRPRGYAPPARRTGVHEPTGWLRAPLRPRPFRVLTGERRGDPLGAEPGPESLPVAVDTCNEQGRCWHGAERNYSPATAQCLLYDKLKT